MSLRNVFRFIVSVLLVLLLAGAAQAAPFLVCAPQIDVTVYELAWDGGPAERVNAELDGSIHYDVAGLSIGATNGTIRCGKAWVLDGISQTVIEWQEEAPVPFVLGRPGAAGVASGLGLSAD